MKFSKLSLLAFCLSILVIDVLAQNQLMVPPGQTGDLNFKPQSVLPPPVEAAALNKGGDVQVNLAIGSPGVTVPVADVRSRAIQFPVTLNYASNGVQVNELAGNTGLGWSLNCGGNITRTTLGLPDELRPVSGPDNFTVTSADINPLKRTSLGYLTYPYDRESDIFNFSVSGFISGKFILDQNRQPQMLDGRNYKISLLSTTIRDGFKIIDEQGMVFLFTVMDTSYYDRGECGDGGERNRPVYNTWHLSRIIKPYQDTVYFNYINNHYSYLADVNENESICVTSGIGGCGDADPTGACPLWVSQYTACQNKQTVDGNVLSQIVFTNGSLNFEYTDGRVDMEGGKAMKSITLKNLQDTLKYVRLITDYGQRRGTGFDILDTTLRYRLFLRSVQVGGSKSFENEHRYEFSYLNEDNLPGRMSTKQDMYGLPNGDGNTGKYFLTNVEEDPYVQEMYPGLNYYSQVPLSQRRYTDRSIKPEFMNAGLLNKIVYPTGGSDSIVYTPNVRVTPKEKRNFYLKDMNVCSDAPPVGGFSDTLLFTVASRPGSVDVQLDLRAEPRGTIWYVHDNVRARIIRVSDNYQVTTMTTNIDLGDKQSILSLGGGDYYLITTTMTKNVCAESYLNYEGVPDTLIVDDPIGGVSVASIISHDPVAGVRQVKNYSYKYRDSSQYSTFRINENDFNNVNSYVYSRMVKMFMNCDRAPDCAGLAFCSYLVHGGSQILPQSVMGSSGFYHASVIETVTGADSIDRSTEHVYDFKTLIVGRVDHGSYIPGTPFGILPDFLMGERKTSNYSYNRLSGQETTFNTTVRTYNMIEKLLAENFNVTQVYTSPCVGSGPIATEAESEAFNVTTYPVYYQEVQLASQTDSVFSPTGSLVQSVTHQYTGNPYNLPRKTISINSIGKQESSETKYIFDEPANPMYTPMLTQNKLSVISASTFTDTALTKRVLVTYKSLPNSIISDYKVDEQYPNRNIGNLSEKTKFDAFGNVLEANVKTQFYSYIWGYGQSQVIAAVDNAAYDDIAYSSFEGNNDGSWVIPSTTRSTLSSITGKTAFSLDLAGSTGIVKAGLTAAKTYIVTYWTKNPVAYTIAGSVETRKGTVVSGWTCFEHRVRNVTQVKINGTGLIDELRLYPDGASMKTFTYIPLVGVSSQCDATGNILNYEYDRLGRLMVVRNAYGEILKQIDYRYQSPAN